MGQLDFFTLFNFQITKKQYIHRICYLYTYSIKQPSPHNQPYFTIELFSMEDFTFLGCSHDSYFLQIMAEQQNLSEFNRYLINNRDLLVEKYQEYFGKNPTTTIRTLAVQAVIDYIYDIFSFAKYKHNQNTHNKIVESLRKNILDFINQNQARHHQIFKAETAIEALTYCITHNDMFSVQYDIQKPNKNKVAGEEDKSQPTFVVEIKDNSNLGRQSFSENQKHEEGSSRIQQKGDKYASKINHVKSQNKQQYLLRRSHSKRASNINQSQKESENEFDHKSYINKFSDNLDTVKKNAKLVYGIFCKNQMQLGGLQTFDRLQEESSTMTTGKLLVYAKAYNMFNDKITKELLIQRFRKISDGKRAINFQKFYIMLTQLLSIDPHLFQRLELFDQNLYLRVKFVKYPFYTQDQQPRELIAMRGFSNKLTAHSGKTHQELKEEINQRKLQMRYGKSLPKYSSEIEVFKREGKQKLLTPRDLAVGAKSRNFSIELSFIDKIVSPEDSDHKYLLDYEIEHYHPKDRDTSISKSTSIVSSRKDSIVQNIRKRITQIESSENDAYRHISHSYLRKRKPLH